MSFAEAFTAAHGGANWPRPLILLCALLANGPQNAIIAASPLTDVEWDSFTDLVIARHRVAPSTAEALRTISAVLPGRVLDAIRAEARANGFAALAQKAESLVIADALGAVGIRAIWLKGWPLAEQLYGALGRRHSNDIDILVRADERIAAAQCLREAGYVPDDVHAVRARLIAHPAVREECKDVQYRHATTGLMVELHWRISHFRAWPELADLDEPPVALPGMSEPGRVLVLGPLGQLVYLAEHGQQHLFSRLKWLLDIARLARLRGPARLDDDLRLAEAAGVGRAVRLALNLSYQVFGADVPAKARELPWREARWAAEILADIADPAAAPGGIRARIEFYRWHFRMAETPAQAVGVLRFALWRRLRLRLAGLAHPAHGTDA